jgi:hypothetical protein
LKYHHLLERTLLKRLVLLYVVDLLLMLPLREEGEVAEVMALNQQALQQVEDPLREGELINFIPLQQVEEEV